MRTSGFRDDIQGVRAIAVLAVVVYHAGLGPVTGGFVGLDVFFVVSGFLITSLLLREQQRTGRVSLSGFYARRARRILPAATFVLLVTVAGSWLLLNLVDARDAAYDALWASLFVANVRFAAEQTDYFSRDEASSPLQHFWSLSVEEQFYLVLPVLMVLCAAWALRRGALGADRSGPRGPTGTLALVIGVLSLASLAWSLHATAASPQTAYFSTFTRIWEFGVGALLAIATPRFARLLTARSRNLLGALGLAAILLACVRFTGATAFPGYAALLPVLGAGALLVAGAEQRSAAPAVQRLLGAAPMRAIGDASYSIYLWHWPVLLIAAERAGRELRLGETLLALAGVLALSWFSYRWIETPFRRAAPRPAERALVLYPVSVAVVLAGCLASSAWVAQDRGPEVPPIATSDFREQPGVPELAVDPAVALVEASVLAAREDAPIPTDLSPPLLGLREDKVDLGDCDYGGPPYELCPRGAEDGTRSLVVLGDSHGRHWIPALERVARRTGHVAHYLVKSACTPARVVTVQQETEEEWDDCTDFNAWAAEQVAKLQPDLVLVSTTPPGKLIVDGEATNDEDTVVTQMRRGFEELLADLSASATRTVVLGDTPRLPFEPTECLGARDASLGDCAGAGAGRQLRAGEASRQAALAAGVDFVDTLPWFCADDVCPAVIGSRITMRDRGHVTSAYAASLAEPLGRALGLLPALGTQPSASPTATPTVSSSATPSPAG